MSKKETQKAEQTPEKVVTKYDLKVRRRQELKEKEKREQRISKIVCIVMLAAVVCLVASFPIRNWLMVNGTYLQVDGEKISRVEFDYNYGLVSSNFLAQNATYLYYMGVDLSGDLSKQMYSETLTWKDYFDQLATENIARTRGLMKEAQAEGFAYDTARDYETFEKGLEQSASAAGVSGKEYIRQIYGAYATSSRLKPYIEQGLYLEAYTQDVQERLAPSQEEIEAYYQEHKADYDWVDYYLLTVDAQLPTEPTELADPVDEAAADGEGEDSEAAYQPSQAEIDAAMEAAHAQAQESESKVKTLGELKEGSTQMEAMYMLRDWLFDEARAEGDTTVIEDSTNHRYYVLEFKRRYLDQSPSVDLRILAASREEAQSIMDEWKQGEATEESFAVIYDKYNTIMTAPKGGLYEGLTSSSGLPQEITDWFLDSSRKEGDAEVFAPEGLELSYVCYYVGLNEPSWFLGIKTTLTDQSLDEYMHERLDSVEIQDPKGNLKYLQEPEEESTEGSDAESAGSGESTEGSDAESTEPQESTEGSDAESTEP